MTACALDLERNGRLVAIDAEIDPHLEASAIVRRVYDAKGPAVLFRNVKGCAFPLLGNLFGTLDRARFIFRDALAGVERLVALKADPARLLKRPANWLQVPATLWNLRPKFVDNGPILDRETRLDALPQVVSWPDDGGAFVTLPLVYTEDPDAPGWIKSNLGMYRVQISGNDYLPNRETGLHYQIHRGIGVHHAAAIRRGEPLRVNVLVGGPPSLTIAAMMPLPEGMTELAFAGALGGRRLEMIRGERTGGLPIPARADFCISGTIDPDKLKPEGPFGDHLGYYSLKHDFPVLNVERVRHRPGAIWLFTSVGRPPREDTTFGELVHELTGPIVPALVPGLKAVHAVDAAGVHPLLLTVARERYVPYDRPRRPLEVLTTANAVLGQGQLSLAKYLFVVAHEDDPHLDVQDVAAYFRHVLERVDWSNDLHFQTRTTIDTLDYSGDALNLGSKVVIAAVGPKKRDLATEIPADLILPDEIASARVALPGVLVAQAPPYDKNGSDDFLRRFCSFYQDRPERLEGFPLAVLADDAEFASRTLRNWLWTTFTRSNPAADIDGVRAFVDRKHWGCAGSLAIDARIKPRHAPPLIDDPEIEKRVDRLGAPGGPLHGLI